VTGPLDLFRRLVLGSDAAAAHSAETRAVTAARDVPVLPGDFADEMRRRETKGAGARLGTCLDDAAVSVRVGARDLVGKTHALVLGATGSGKTRLAMLFLAELYQRFAEDRRAPVPWVIDHKGEFAEEAENLARRCGVTPRVFDPFDSARGLPFQVLRKDDDPRVTVDLQAFDVLTLLERATNADLGVKQDLFVHHLLVLGIEAGLDMPALAELTFEPVRLVSEATCSKHPGVRRYFGGKAKLSEASLEGVRARFHRLLRLPTTRAMLSAASCTNLRHVLATTPLIANLGRVPLGAEDIGRFWSALFTTKVTRALFDRSEAEREAVIFIDEWQEGLLAGPDVAEQYERSLSMARSRRVAFVLVSQSLAGAAKVSASLPKVVATNTDVQFIGRVSQDDARLMKGILPTTGRRRRETPAPWEKAGPAYLTQTEELERLVHEAANLPHRNFWFFHRGAHDAVRFRTAEIAAAPPAEGEHHEANISGLRRVAAGVGMPRRKT
jgi:hypothetical protein